MSQLRYRTRIAETPDDLVAVQRLRSRAFYQNHAFAPKTDELDADPFDMRCTHVLVEDEGTSTPVATFRLLRLESGAEIHLSYSAQRYDLKCLSGFHASMIELGRFCVDPDLHDPDILRSSWAALTRYVDRENIQMIFGCSSFKGFSAEKYEDAFALLRDQHLAPKHWMPQAKAPEVVRFADCAGARSKQESGLRKMPSLLRSYLALGAWVSDHAVVDRELNTMHVFTGLEVRSIPPARARVLRATVGPSLDLDPAPA